MVKESDLLTCIQNLPTNLQAKIVKLDRFVYELSKVSFADIKLMNQVQLTNLKLKLIEVEELHQEIKRNNIVAYIGQDRTWAALDQLTIQEINRILSDITNHYDDIETEITFTNEVIDVCEEKEDDDFEDEEESFW